MNLMRPATTKRPPASEVFQIAITVVLIILVATKVVTKIRQGSLLSHGPLQKGDPVYLVQPGHPTVKAHIADTNGKTLTIDEPVSPLR